MTDYRKDILAAADAWNPSWLGGGIDEAVIALLRGIAERHWPVYDTTAESAAEWAATDECRCGESYPCPDILAVHGVAKAVVA